MATSEPLPQRPTRKSRRLRGQEPQQATPEKVVGSVATPHPKIKDVGRHSAHFFEGRRLCVSCVQDVGIGNSGVKKKVKYVFIEFATL